ncbi:MAG: cytochrome c biogenesis CcdA family protein [Actinomycetota bacterium]|nr:cytochrome c biogenesis CcdA family protein [Actinomycetota bacterium]
MTGLTEFVISGPVLVAALLAVAAGTVSFASPCCLPLVPGYLAYLTGLAGGPISRPGLATSVAAESGGASAGPLVTAPQWRLVGAAALFTAGFTVVFTAEVMSVLGLSDLLALNEQLLQRIGGVVTMIMGLAFVGWVPLLQRQARVHLAPRGGLAGAPLLGAVFGLGWTPCLGPTLTGVIALAAGTQAGPGTWRGLTLVLAYGLGLGLPFIALALGAGWALRATSWLRRHARVIQLAGGVLLFGIGLLLVTGLWGEFIAWLRAPIGGFTTPL